MTRRKLLKPDPYLARLLAGARPAGRGHLLDNRAVAPWFHQLPPQNGQSNPDPEGET